MKLKYNSAWLGKMNFADVVELASHFTVQQILERDMFENRIKAEKPIYLHEFLYPLMQGQDSVAMDVDGEIGGNDQTFNMLAGRTLQKQIHKKEKFVITNTLLVDPSGKKMGKSEGNMIAMTDSAKDMFGKIMSWPDEMIAQGFRLCTDKEEKEITDMEKAMRSGENPMQFKKALARDIVAWLIGKKDAEEAEKYMEGFAQHQTGSVGDMTAGREPADYVSYPSWELYAQNGRVVIELEPAQFEILTQPIPACESDPLDRKKQAENMANFLCGVAAACGIPEQHAIAAGNTVAVERAKKVIANDKIRGMKLLPKELREKLPPLYSQDGKGGKAVVYTKYFTPSSNWTWLEIGRASCRERV